MIYKNTLFIFMKVPKIPASKGTTTSVYLRMKLLSQWPGVKYVEFADDNYDLHEKADYSEMMTYNLFKTKDWMPDYDCDNFQYSLKGLFANIAPRMIVGIVNVDVKSDKSRHALNLIYDKKAGKFMFLEPQSGEIFFKADYMPYCIII